MSAEMSVEYQPRCRSSVSRDVGQVSAEMSVECRPRCRVSANMLVEYRLSVDRDTEMSVEVSAERAVNYQLTCRSSVDRDVGRVSGE